MRIVDLDAMLRPHSQSVGALGLPPKWTVMLPSGFGVAVTLLTA